MTATAINLIASSNADLLDKVYTLMTSHADLISAGEEWDSMEYTAGESFIIRSVQAGDTQDIYIGWRVLNDVGNDVYNIEIRGFGGYIAGGILWDDQPDAMTESVYLCSYNQDLNYWIVANHRRFIVVEKVSTVYLSAYCGLYVPYATPSQYPYPMFVSASAYTWNTRWSAVSGITHAGRATGSTDAIVSGYIRDNGGWKAMRSSAAAGTNYTGDVTVLPFYYAGHRTDIRNDIDDTYTVEHAYIMNHINSAIEGFMDGYGWITGFQLTAESTVTIDGDTWLVVHDVFRTDLEDYYAVRLV